MDPKSVAEQFDLVVVGAGWYGLTTTRTYITLHPDKKVALLEAADTVGGTWAKHRIWHGLKTNHRIGRCEHPDVPMDEATYGVKAGEHIPSEVMHRYLTDFAKQSGVFELIRFNHKLDLVSPCQDDSWALEVSEEGKKRTIFAKKLIIATGLTSRPNMPRYAGEETFDAPIFHSKDFSARIESVKTSKNAVVIGGAKSAYDVAWAYASAGVQVDLIIRPSGNGPVWLSPALVTPFKEELEKLLHIRALSWFSPNPFGAEDGFAGIRNWLHGTAIGRFMVNIFWKIIGGDVLGLMGWDKHPETAKLKPWNSSFWTATALSIDNWDTSFLDLIKGGKIRVHTADVEHLSEKKVHLTTGAVLDTDVLVCATGWLKDPSTKFLANIGLPQSMQEQKLLEANADNEILARFPRLKDQPPNQRAPADPEPYRLYRFIVPPAFINKRNIAFAGMVSTVSTTACAAMQGLWINAFFEGKLDRLNTSEDEIAKEVMLYTQWGKWRFPSSFGSKVADLAFDCMPYNDMLMRDLGLRFQRKDGIFSNLFYVHGPADYRNLIDEWRDADKQKKTK